MKPALEARANLPSRLRRRRRRLALIVRETAARAARWALLALGTLVFLAGVVLTPLPGHLGLPLLVVGLMIVLRNSFGAKRRFLRWQRRHPKLIFPIRRLMRREPEITLVAWQQLLRSEKLLLRKPSWRVLKRGRKHFKRRWLKKQPDGGGGTPPPSASRPPPPFHGQEKG